MRNSLSEELQRRVLVLDGAMGTMIQRLELDESDFRGKEFTGWHTALKGCNDLLCITQPDEIRRIHSAYVDAGADIIETNTFNANAISLKDYGLQDYVERINMAGAEIARQAAGDSRFVVGSMGPTNVSLSMPTGHNESFDSLAEAFHRQALALICGGVDALLIETAFDTLNAKAAICGARHAMREAGRNVPLMISATLTDSGRLLSGQTLEAFVIAVSHADPISIGLNCGFGADSMLEFLPVLQNTPYYISAHPNAGLPDEMGKYVETPDKMAAYISRMLDKKLVNIIGGCCGTTPDHIRKIAELANQARPRVPEQPDCNTLRLCGLEIMKPQEFIKVGERCNVAGSRKFLRLIEEGNIDEAVTIAASQIDRGAAILDVNMDDGMLDTAAEMERFVTQLGLDSRTAGTPLMIDSSDFSVITNALKRIQGKPIVNSISLKEGEQIFLEHASEIKDLGAAVVVMAFDETGQATSYERRIEICGRAYRLLTEQAGFSGNDIVFDPNVLTVATGIEEHQNYALDFLRAVKWIKANCPGAKVSGGVSNLSFSFRGNNAIREAMHSVFLSHGRRRGMDMAIVNPSTPISDEHLSVQIKEAIEDVLLNRQTDATSRLIETASAMFENHVAHQPAKPQKTPAVSKPQDTSSTLADMIEHGVTEGLKNAIDTALKAEGSAIAVINSRLMPGMNHVGELFGAGKMFLPQVVRSASVMKHAVEYLTPLIEAEAAAKIGSSHSSVRPKMVIATVKGDVHDIGKNIVAVIMRCSGFEMIDLGVMVPAKEIIAKAKEIHADLIGLSGLITPSLHEMTEVARLMKKEGMDIPLFIGGATTSAIHTAVKIAPEYDGPVIHTSDAASLPKIANELTASELSRLHAIQKIKQEQSLLRQKHLQAKFCTPLGLNDARKRHCGVKFPSPVPKQTGVYTIEIYSSQIVHLINWREFLWEWGLNPNGTGIEAERLINDAKRLMDGDMANALITARIALLPAVRQNDDIIINNTYRLPTLRSQTPNPVTQSCPSIADFIAEADDHIGLFAVTVNSPKSADTEYKDMLRQTIAHRFAEAATEYIHQYACVSLWGLDKKCGIRPAIGYSSLPDQSLIFELDRFLKFDEIGIKLTENGAMSPSASTAGLVIVNNSARYFEIGMITDEQCNDYCVRRNITLADLNRFLR